MKRLLLIVALAVCAVAAAQTPQYLPTTGGTLKGPLNVAQLNGAGLRGMTQDSFGDSITQIFDASPWSSSYTALIAANRGYTYTQTCGAAAGCDHGVAGDRLSDLSYHLEHWTYPLQVVTQMIGQNDGCNAQGEREGPVAWANQYMGTVAWDVTPNKVAANAAGVTSTGVWASAGSDYYAGAMQTSTNGATMTFANIRGTVVYVWLESIVGSTSTATITTDNGSFAQANSVSLGAASTSVEGFTHTMTLVRLVMLNGSAHTITVTAAYDGTHPIVVNAVAGNAGQATINGGPWGFYAYNTPTQGVGETYLTTCRQSIDTAVGTVASDGFRVYVVDTNSYCYAKSNGGAISFPASYLCIGGDGTTHPDNAGHQLIANAFIDAMTNFIWQPNIGDSLNGLRPNSADGSRKFTFGNYAGSGAATTSTFDIQSKVTKNGFHCRTDIDSCLFDTGFYSPQRILTRYTSSTPGTIGGGGVQDQVLGFSIALNGATPQTATVTATFNTALASFKSGYACDVTLVTNAPSNLIQRYLFTGQNGSVVVGGGMYADSYPASIGVPPVFLTNPQVVGTGTAATGMTVDVAVTAASGTTSGMIGFSCWSLGGPQLTITSPGGLAIGAPFTTVATTYPTIAAGLQAAPQTANFVLAGPTGGGSAMPTFRALVAADIPGGSGGPVILSAQGGLTDTVNCPANTTANFATTYTIPLNTITTGTILDLKLGFTLATTATVPNMSFRLSIGGTSVFTAASTTITATAIPMGIGVEFLISGKAVPSASSAVVTNVIEAATNQNAMLTPFAQGGAVNNLQNLATNGALVIQPVFFCSAATAGNSLTLNSFVLTQMH